MASLTGSLAQNGVQLPPRATPPVKPPAPADSLSKTDAPKPAPRLSPWAGEIVKLTQAGLDDSVVFSFIENSGTFNLGADQIIHLAGAGVSTPVITAMLQHDADLASGAKLLTIASHPKMDPEVEKALARLREADEKAAASIPIPPTGVAPAATEWAVVQDSEPVVEAGSAVNAGAPAKPRTAVGGTSEPSNPTTATSQSTVPQKPASLYRVREPHAVELVPPFLVINAASKTPNLVVIDMFPSSR